MVTLRCTAKMRAWLGIEPHPPSPRPPTNALGDWYANILRSRHGTYVVCLSERTGLVVVLEAKRPDTLVPRFLKSLGELLGFLGVPAAAVEDELARTADLAFGATTNRSALGMLNQVVRELRVMSPLRPEFRISDWQRHFSHRPCGKHLQFPDEVARRLLGGRPRFSVIRGGAA